MVSEIGLGTYPLSGATFTKGPYWEGPSAYGHVSAQEARETILRGLELGLNFIDAAPVYGQAETVIGETLGGKRQGVIVETKVGEYQTPDDILARDFSEAHIRRSVAESKRRLRVDVIDILLLHSPTREEFGYGEPLDVLCHLRDEGEVRFIGISVGGGAEEAIGLIRGSRARPERSRRVDILQVAFNLLQPEMADDVFSLAQAEGVGVVVRVPLASGFLTGRIREDHVFAPDDYRSKMPREAIARNARRAKEFEFLVQGDVATLPEAALRYILSFDALSTVIAGAMNPRELEQNLAASDKGPLPSAALEEIRTVQKRQISNQ
jgi:aryl-alcohol dehydrogenase-like predicted oxidoreductase